MCPEFHVSKDRAKGSPLSIPCLPAYRWDRRGREHPRRHALYQRLTPDTVSLQQTSTQFLRRGGGSGCRLAGYGYASVVKENGSFVLPKRIPNERLGP